MPIFSFMGYTLTGLLRKLDNWQQVYKQTILTFYTSNDVSIKRIKKKKLLGRHNRVAKCLFNCFTKNTDAATWGVLWKNCSWKLRNIHMTNRKKPALESLFSSECCKIFKSASLLEHLQTAASRNLLMKLSKIKNYSWGVLTLH